MPTDISKKNPRGHAVKREAICQKIVSYFSTYCLGKFSNCYGVRFRWVAEMRRLAVGTSIVLWLFAGANAFAASTFTVTTLADTTGSCTGNTCTTLRAAIAAANSSAGNTINFTGLSGTITLTSALSNVTQSMTITGPGASSLTISGGNASNIFNIQEGPVTISGLTLANGGGLAGCAILNYSTLTVINNVFFQNCTAGTGVNSVESGGAIANYGALTVVDSTFSDNGSPSIANVNGGAIFSDNSSTLTVINSTFSRNYGYYGGAIDNSGTLTVINNTFSGNSAYASGGAIMTNGVVTADNNILVGNSAAANGGAGISNYGNGAINASNNLYYQNLDTGSTEDDCNACTTNINAVTGSNPNLLPLGNYGGPMQTLLPQPDSPAICAGSYADVPNGTTTDQRGFPLSIANCGNGGVDAGSVQTSYLQVTTTADSNDGSCTASLCSLRDAVTAANAGGSDIAFASGVTGTITLTSALPAISQSMVILGPRTGTLAISGNNAYQIFDFNNASATVVISGLTLANGNQAIYSESNLTVADTTFSANTNAAIANSGPLTVTDSTFSGNSGDYGGAISSYGAMMVTNCTFSGNTAVNGGGAITSNVTLNVTNSTFSGNSTTDAIAANGAYGGGAILSFGTNLTVTASTFSGNSTAAWGGAIYAYGSFSPTFTASNNIFVGNTVSNSYGGAAITAFVGTSNANYNLFYQNLNGSGTENDCDDCTSNTNAITGNNPLLAALASYGGPTQSMLPQPGSPAICAGSTALIPTGITTDQRGFSRTTTYSGTACVDLGAVQTDYTAVAFSSSSYSGVANQAVNPAPVVTVTENGQNIGGVPITLGFSGTGSPSGLGPVTAVGGTGATFSSLTASSAAQGTLSVTSPITASGNAVQPAALTASATLDIHLATQAITFVAASPVTYGTAPITLTATGGVSGNPVTFSLDPTTTPGTASLSGSTLTIHGVGTIVIDANQAAGPGYAAAAQVQQTIVVSPTSVTLTASSPTVTYGSAVPTITPIFGTFFNGDTSAVLTTQPTCVTAYTTTSAVGSSPATSCSGAAAANYTFTYINGSVTIIPAPMFAIGGGSASISIEPGATTGNTVSVPVTPSNGFTGTVKLSCSISPVAANNPPTCSLSPGSVTITGTEAETSTLTISTTASTVSENRLNRLLWRSGGTALALVLVIWVPRRRRAWLTMVGVLALSIAVAPIGCGGGGSSSGGGTSGSSGTTPGTYTITVAGTSGGVTGTAGTVTLTVQ